MIHSFPFMEQMIDQTKKPIQNDRSVLQVIMNWLRSVGTNLEWVRKQIRQYDRLSNISCGLACG